MFLDPNKKGIEVWYNDKMRNLVGGVEDCVEWIIEVSLEEFDQHDEWQQEVLKYEEWSPVYFKDKKYVQYSKNIFMLDCNGFGRIWADYFEKINLKYKEVDIKRINL